MFSTCVFTWGQKNLGLCHKESRSSLYKNCCLSWIILSPQKIWANFYLQLLQYISCLCSFSPIFFYLRKGSRKSSSFYFNIYLKDNVTPSNSLTTQQNVKPVEIQNFLLVTNCESSNRYLFWKVINTDAPTMAIFLKSCDLNIWPWLMTPNLVPTERSCLKLWSLAYNYVMTSLI